LAFTPEQLLADQIVPHNVSTPIESDRILSEILLFSLTQD